MKRTVNRYFILFVACWAILQIILIIVFRSEPFGNDTNGYVQNTIRCYEEGDIYPRTDNLYDVYIQAPGLINFFLLPIYAIFHHIKVAMFGNLVMNIIILFEVFYLAKRFFSKKTAYISSVTYALILSNIFAPTLIMSEVLYLFLAISGFCLSISNKWYKIIFGALFYAMAYMVKPLVMAFIVATVVYYVVSKYKIRNYVLLAIFCILPLLIVGEYNVKRIGYPALSSSTGGYNLLMTANDKATPLPNHSIYLDKNGIGHAYLVGHYTFAQKDSVWKGMAIKWIKEHPARYMLLCVERVAVMYNKDTWSIPSLFGEIDDPTAAIKTHDRKKIVQCQIIRMSYSLVYYCVCFIFLVSLFKYRKKIFSKKGVLLLILLLGIGGTCLFPMEHRYHYPYMFIIVIWASAFLEDKYSDLFCKNDRNKE